MQNLGGQTTNIMVFSEEANSKRKKRLFQRSIEEYDRKNGQNKQKQFHIRPINGLITVRNRSPFLESPETFRAHFG